MNAILEQQTNLFFLDSISVKSPVRYHLLCVHGLNQNPESLKPLLEDLGKRGIACHLLHLPGHLSDHELNKRVTKDMILAAYTKAYEEVQELAQSDGVPIGLFGYSFGGLIGISMLRKYQFKKVILLAPALKLRPYAHGLRPLLPLLSRVFSVPLGGRRYEERYRFHHGGVPRAVYKTFFEIYDQFQFQWRTKHYTHGVEGIVFAHPRDELVSFNRLRRWLKRNSQWQLKKLNNRQASFGRYKHLIFDEMTLGKDTYLSMVNEAARFLTK